MINLSKYNLHKAKKSLGSSVVCKNIMGSEGQFEDHCTSKLCMKALTTRKKMKRHMGRTCLIICIISHYPFALSLKTKYLSPFFFGVCICDLSMLFSLFSFSKNQKLLSQNLYILNRFYKDSLWEIKV